MVIRIVALSSIFCFILCDCACIHSISSILIIRLHIFGKNLLITYLKKVQVHTSGAECWRVGVVVSVIICTCGLCTFSLLTQRKIQV